MSHPSSGVSEVKVDYVRNRVKRLIVTVHGDKVIYKASIKV